MRILLFCLSGLLATGIFAQRTDVILNDRTGDKAAWMVSESRTMNPANDTRHKSQDDASHNLITENVSSFSLYFDDRLIDSFWEEFKKVSPRGEATDQYSTNHIIQYTPEERNYAFLFKVIYGGNFELSVKQMSLIRDTVSHTQTAAILYKAHSTRSDGLLRLTFDIVKNRGIVLQNINFFPFDHAPNAFISNLCDNELKLINAQQTSILIDSVSQYADADRAKQMKGLKKKLEAIKLPSDPLFTSRLFIEKETLWVLAIFDTDKPDVHLSIAYKLVNKKLKPALIELLKKDG